MKSRPIPISSRCEGEGGENLRTAVTDEVNRQLNPDWVEFLMDWPIGWTDINSRTLEYIPWSAGDPHPRIPRTIHYKSDPNRRQRLQALGNGMVPASFILALEYLLDIG